MGDILCHPLSEAITRADRLISLILILQRRGPLTCAALARELEVSRRTILRDIDALSYAGIPVIAEGGPGGGVRLRDDYRTSLTGLKDGEVRSLLVSGDGALFGDLGWGNDYRESRLKLDASLAASARAEAETAQRRLFIDSRWWWHQEQPEETLGLLRKAVFSDRTVEFEYERFDGRRSRKRVDAYALVAKSGLWYLVGGRGGDMRCYRASRISAPTMAGGRFPRDPDFDIRSWWLRHSESFSREFSEYRFTLSIAETELLTVQHMVPGRVRVVGKGRRLKVELGVESEWLAQIVVMGLGSRCRIVSPKELAASVGRKARDVLEALGEKSPDAMLPPSPTSAGSGPLRGPRAGL